MTRAQFSRYEELERRCEEDELGMTESDWHELEELAEVAIESIQ